MDSPNNAVLHGVLDLEPAQSLPRLTHQLFRYPAKFHPPVAVALLERYTQVGDRVLDPFCGSGTLLVEAAVRGRDGVGIDIDPVAVEVANAKSLPLDLPALEQYVARVMKRVRDVCPPAAAYDDLIFDDWSREELEAVLVNEDLWVPEIPNLHHWFRNYVIGDLARILKCIEEEPADEGAVAYVRVVFASIIRNASNADPVPVSGLEVTSHMLRREAAGRIVNPPRLFETALKKSLQAAETFASAAVASQAVVIGDALEMSRIVEGTFDAIITSPPYNNAVDYYRRHQLEMYWLRRVNNHAERLKILPKYVGKHRVANAHPHLSLPWEPGPLTSALEEEMRESSPSRANDFRAYCAAMAAWFKEAGKLISPGGRVVLVVGQSTWSGRAIETELLMGEAASPLFSAEEVLQYPVRNRYMSYSRRNGADIGHELVLDFRRTE